MWHNAIVLNAGKWVFSYKGIRHHHFVFEFYLSVNGYKRQAANGQGCCSFRQCSEVHFIPKVTTIH